MGGITVGLLRRRAEHNEGCLSNLKEIALHQQEIERIEVIGDSCRQLEILYLCNNYIAKIEGLLHLKWLKYLNLAVNSIVVIEGLEGCEALERLDLTLNFVADLTTVRRLRANPFLESLHLVGNPCTKLEDYRAYVIHTLPQLKDLDGGDVVRGERIAARQCEGELGSMASDEAVRIRTEERLREEMRAKGIELHPPRYNEAGERVYGHSPEERLQMLRAQQAEEEERKRQAETPPQGSIAALHKELTKPAVRLSPEEEMAKYGRLLLRNEGRLVFHVNEDDPAAFIVTVEPGKFIATSLLRVDVEVHCVRVYVKEKLLQIPTELELAPDRTEIQRATTTGQLKITVPFAPDAVRGMRPRASARTIPRASTEEVHTKAPEETSLRAGATDSPGDLPSASLAPLPSSREDAATSLLDLD